MTGQNPFHRQGAETSWRLGGRTDFEILVFERLASTNDTLRDLAAAGAPEGTAVVARAQTAGRGRHGRSWHSPAGAGLYASILLRPPIPAREVQMLTFVAAVAVAEALVSFGATGAEIKWPNDLLLARRKVSGVLVETSLVAESVEWAVVGIGVNVARAAVPAELVDRATSLEEAGIAVDSDALCERILGRLGSWYGVLLDDGPRAVLARWLELAPMASGERVRVEVGEERYEAVTRGVTPAGLLRVERDGGHVEELSAGEVTLGSSP